MHRLLLFSVCGVSSFLCTPGHAQAEAPASRIQLVADARRELADLQRQPDGLEEIAALRSGLSVLAWPTAIAVHPDGSRIALSDESGRVDLWKWQENRHIPIKIESGYFHRIEFSRDGKVLFTADGESGFTIRSWDSHTGSLKTALGNPASSYSIHAGAPRFWQASDHLIAFLPEPLSTLWSEVVGQQEDWRPRLLQTPILNIVRDGKIVRQWSAPGAFRSLLFNPQRRFIGVLQDSHYDRKNQSCMASLDWDFPYGCPVKQRASVEIYDLDSGRKISSLQLLGRMFNMWRSPANTDLVITSRAEGTENDWIGERRWSSEIWDTTTGKRIAKLKGAPSNEMVSARLPPEFSAVDEKGRWHLFDTGSGHVVWDGQTRALIPNLRLKGHAVFAPGSSLLLHAPEEGAESSMVLWDLAGQKQVPLKGPQQQQQLRRSLQVPPRVAASARAGLVAVWKFLYGTSGTGGYHVYGPEGDTVISIWNVRTGELWGTLGGHRAPVRFVEFSADGRLVFTVDAEANVKVWRVQPARD